MRLAQLQISSALVGHRSRLRCTILPTLLSIASIASGCDHPSAVSQSASDGTRSVALARAITKDAVHVPTGTYVLLRRLPRHEGGPIEFAAIKLSEPRSDGVVEYDCSYVDDGTRSWAKVPMSHGVLAERLTKSSTPGVFSTKQSSVDIVCGSFKLMWSVGNWVYFYESRNLAPPARAHFDIALSTAKNLEQIDCFAVDLDWRTFVPET